MYSGKNDETQGKIFYILNASDFFLQVCFPLISFQVPEKKDLTPWDQDKMFRIFISEKKNVNRV